MMNVAAKWAFVLVLLTPLVSPVSARQTGEDSRYLIAALETANWLESVRIEKEGASYWPVAPVVSDDVAENLYSGTSGVVLFYLKLHEVTGEERFLKTALSGADGLVEYLQSLEDVDPAYWTGYAGVAAVLLEAYRLSGEQSYLNTVEQCLQRLKAGAVTVTGNGLDGLQYNSVTDVIAGSAGIGFFLLCVDEVLPESDCISDATAIGDGLIARAMEVELAGGGRGLKWLMSPGYPREMPNYSHGTAGICDFLLALHMRVVESYPEYDGRFAEAAIAGAHYLVDMANRDDEGVLIDHHIDVDTTNPERQAEEEPLYYLGWCHGPSGTGRLFMNLAVVFPDDEQWEQLAAGSGRSLLSSGVPQPTPGFWDNVGMCCGSAGVSTFLIDLYHQTHKPELKELAVRLADDALARATHHAFENGAVGLSWSHAEHRVRPELVQEQTGVMQGAAGMGLWFLKVDALVSDREFEMRIPLQPLGGPVN